MTEAQEKERESLQRRVFEDSEKQFSAVALEVFRYQYRYNDLYRQYCELINVGADCRHIEAIPFLPISFFKTREVKTGEFNGEPVFESSGTTGSVNSRHFLNGSAIYTASFQSAFRRFYGNERGYCIVGLLPSYLQRSGSSLVFMVDQLIRDSAHADSGFYLDEFEKLHALLAKNEAAGTPTLLIGVTYALLDFFERNPIRLVHTIVMETGGMKGRREELMRSAVHDFLRENTGLREIHAEYGMTELLSQAYSAGHGIFSTPPWMRVLIRAEDDPREVSDAEDNLIRNGAINIIDLANLDSCAFIATDDAGRLHGDRRFEVLGRLDNSDIRGCSLMYV